MGGGRFSGDPSRILGVPLGCKAQPAGLAVLAAIFTIYTADMAYKRKDGAHWWNAIVQGCVGLLVIAMYIRGYSYTEGFGDSSWRITLPIALGLVGGLTAWSSLEFTGNGHYLPVDNDGAGPPSGEYSKCVANGPKGASGKGGAAGERNEFVCDAYLNGKRIGTIPT